MLLTKIWKLKLDKFTILKDLISWKQEVGKKPLTPKTNKFVHNDILSSRLPSFDLGFPQGNVTFNNIEVISANFKITSPYTTSKIKAKGKTSPFNM
jgi:hypothetical protein